MARVAPPAHPGHNQNVGARRRAMEHNRYCAPCREDDTLAAVLIIGGALLSALIVWITS